MQISNQSSQQSYLLLSDSAVIDNHNGTVLMRFLCFKCALLFSFVILFSEYRSYLCKSEVR